MRGLTNHVRVHRGWYSLALSLVAPLVVAASFVAFRSSFSNVGAALTLVAVVEAMAVLGHRRGGLVATLSAALWFDFFLTTPYEHFSISHRPDLETTLSLVVIGVIITEVAARSRRHRSDASEEGAFVSLLAEMAAIVAAAPAADVAISRTTEELSRVLELRACHYEATASGAPFAQILGDGNVIHVGMRWPADDMGIPGPFAEITCRWRGARLGRFVLTPTPGRPVSHERRVVAVALVNLVAGLLHDDRGTSPAGSG